MDDGCTWREVHVCHHISTSIAVTSALEQTMAESQRDKQGEISWSNVALLLELFIDLCKPPAERAMWSEEGLSFKIPGMTLSITTFFKPSKKRKEERIVPETEGERSRKRAQKEERGVPETERGSAVEVFRQEGRDGALAVLQSLIRGSAHGTILNGLKVKLCLDEASSGVFPQSSIAAMLMGLNHGK